MIDYQLLVNEALLASQKAYAPYSHYHVGACVLLKDGKMLHGCNVENAAYGSTMCAERNAIYQAYCLGYRKEDIVALAIAHDEEPLVSPCGACRQVLGELVKEDIPIILGCQDYYRLTTMKELLPLAFTGEHL